MRIYKLWPLTRQPGSGKARFLASEQAVAIVAKAGFVHEGAAAECAGVVSSRLSHGTSVLQKHGEVFDQNSLGVVPLHALSLRIGTTLLLGDFGTRLGELSEVYALVTGLFPARNPGFGQKGRIERTSQRLLVQ